MGRTVAQALAVLATGAAAVSFVAGLGVYLYVRFTQGRRGPQAGRDSAPSEAPRK